MKVNVCDVCYYEKEGKPMPVGGVKLTACKYKISRKDQVKKISLDVCEEHKDYFKGCATMDDTEKKVNKLYGIE